METINEDTTKRLSFGDVTQGLLVADPLNVEDVIKAIKLPSVDNIERYVYFLSVLVEEKRDGEQQMTEHLSKTFRPALPRSALTILSESCETRSKYITEAATEQSASIGEADLRRLKRQFSSLKNTFTHYEVKDEFIAALADGLPNGTEDIQLAQFEEEAARNIETLRKMKAANEQSQNELASVIAEIHQLLEDINIQNGHTQSIMNQVAHDIQEDALAQDAMPPLPANGADEDSCQADLTEEAATAQSLEAEIIAISNEIADVESALEKEKEECNREEGKVSEAEALLEELVQRAQTLAQEELDSVSKDQNALLENNKKVLEAKEIAKLKRLRALSVWTEEAISLLQDLGGVVITGHQASQKGQPLEIQLTTTYPTVPVLSTQDVPVACGKVEHRLLLHLNPSGHVVEATLEPADIYIADILLQHSPENTRRPSPGRIVREIRTRICQVKHRTALIQAASAKFPGIASPSNSSLADSFTFPVNLNAVSFMVKISLEECWPLSIDLPEVVSISCLDSSEAVQQILGAANRAVAGMVLGGNLAMSLQEVERAVTSIVQDKI
jgi:hypothetical protein